MTLDALIKLLENLKKKHGGRVETCVAKSSFFDGNGTWDICEVAGAKLDCIEQVDEDGFTKHDSKGNAVTKWRVVLNGGYDY